MVHDLNPDEPIADEVPTTDAIEQRQQVGETPELSETFAPTQVSEIGTDTTPDDADPADWQEQHTTVETDSWEADDR